MLLNNTKELIIEGFYFVYIIVFDKYEKLILTKKNKKNNEELCFKYEFDQVMYDEDDIFLVNEFYHLFVQKFHSHILTHIFNSLVKSKKNEMNFSPKSFSDDSFIWTVKSIRIFLYQFKKIK